MGSNIIAHLIFFSLHTFYKLISQLPHILKSLHRHNWFNNSSVHIIFPSRVVHESGWIGFWVNPYPTQLARVNIKWTHNRPYVQVEASNLGHRLSGSEPLGNFRFEAKEENREIITQTNETIQKSKPKRT